MDIKENKQMKKITSNILTDKMTDDNSRNQNSKLEIESV